MPLTDLQQRQMAGSPVNKLIEYIDKGMAIYPDEFSYVSDEKKQQIEQILSSRPNPQEVAEWNQIISFPDKTSPLYENLVQSYISRWDMKRPMGNHVDEAIQILKGIADARKQAQIDMEQKDWDNVNQFDISSLLRFLTKYPNTPHYNDIDDAVWSLVTTSQNKMQNVAIYLTHFPNGLHAYDASQFQSEYARWMTIKQNGELDQVWNYIQQNPNSLFLSEAQTELLRLKGLEIQSMKQNPSGYSIQTLLYYLNNGCFTDGELISYGVVTPSILPKLNDLSTVMQGLPDLMVEAQNCRQECAEGSTDVYFFGIPSTGKSCILMGLTQSPNMDVSLVRAGGPYAAALQQYVDAGCVIGRTPSDFVATIEATIPNGSTSHKINLVEMAGEEFAFKLANNPDRQVSFADMGEGAPSLLSNGNEKVFFLIIDPTAQVVNFTRTTYDVNGNPITTYNNVNQRITLKKMIDLFKLPENANIMRKVKSIHIIMTKADMLGTTSVERDDRAKREFDARYKLFVQPLIELCEEYGINVATNHRPMLYTFSLGNFYVGDVYEYDDTDANKLVDIFRGNTTGMRKRSFIERIKGALNKPVIG